MLESFLSDGVYMARKNRWKIAAELQTRSLSASLGVFNTSKSATVAFRGADRVSLKDFHAKRSQPVSIHMYVYGHAEYFTRTSPTAPIRQVVWRFGTATRGHFLGVDLGTNDRRLHSCFLRKSSTTLGVSEALRQIAFRMEKSPKIRTLRNEKRPKRGSVRGQ